MNIRPISIVDDLVRVFGSNLEMNQVEIKGHGWFIAKPLPYYSVKNTLERIRDAWYVLTNRAFAVQFAQDRFKD